MVCEHGGRGVARAGGSRLLRKLEAEAFQAYDLVRVLPSHDLIYLVVPKAASTRIRTILAAVGGRHSRRLKPSQRPKFREPQGLRSMTVRSFYHLATSPKTSGSRS